MVVILAFIVGIISFNMIAALKYVDYGETSGYIIMLRALGAERRTIFLYYSRNVLGRQSLLFSALSWAH